MDANLNNNIPSEREVFSRITSLLDNLTLKLSNTQDFCHLVNLPLLEQVNSYTDENFQKELNECKNCLKNF